MNHLEQLFKTAINAFSDKAKAEMERLSYAAFQLGYEHATNVLDELSNEAHNQGQQEKAEILRSTAKELRGEDETQDSAE